MKDKLSVCRNRQLERPENIVSERTERRPS
uniref:Uncharacterized protein n=1 Tax=Siphoviridae sp. ctL0q1 TaxID=2825449 RepID=A0A8S5PL32_9CAUD|nr:MAG TPA: hypothetical protein [Siphoviridae sp. ctL0q1]